MKGIEAERQSLRGEASRLKLSVNGIEGFLAIDAGNLIRGLAKGTTYASRYSLRVAIRQNIQSIGLFRKAPTGVILGEVSKSLPGRFIKLTFSNGAVRWISARPGLEARIPDVFPEQPEIVRTNKGGGFPRQATEYKIKALQERRMDESEP